MEDKIEVGEYVRTKFSIGKVKSIGIDESLIYFKNYECLKCVDKKKIVKHSKNIIDLIEAGDYVNGKYVYSVGTAMGNLPIINHTDGTFTPSNMIKSIVTHEQFESVEYKIKEDL